jgi:hypothetical protein
LARQQVPTTAAELLRALEAEGADVRPLPLVYAPSEGRVWIDADEAVIERFADQICEHLDDLARLVTTRRPVAAVLPTRRMRRDREDMPTVVWHPVAKTNRR